MTINLANNNPRIEYAVAQGVVQTVFAIPFEYFSNSDVSIYVDGVKKSEGSDYTLSGGNGSTGTLTFVTASPQLVTGISGGSEVVIVRDVALERTSDFASSGYINRVTLNNQLDTIVAQVSDLNDRVNRTIHLNEYDISADMLLSDARKGKFLSFNDSTGAVETTITTDSFDNSVAAAAASAATASTKAGEASASATASATSASASEAAKDAALAALDSFDDRYLGEKASDPTTDNDGDPLSAGMLYYNTTIDIMKVYTGAIWVAAYASLSGALLAINDLSDLQNVSSARGNLGLGTAAITPSTDYATAAQGVLASTSVQASSITGSAEVPTGTTAQRDGTPAAGYLRFNSTDTSFEGYDGSAWGSIGGGATGGGSDGIFYENDQTVTTSYTVGATRNAMTAGPILINAGVTVTVASGGRWVVL